MLLAFGLCIYARVSDFVYLLKVCTGFTFCTHPAISYIALAFHAATGKTRNMKPVQVSLFCIAA